MFLKVSKEFTDLPGGRYESQGPFSGEEFRRDYLIPYYDLSVFNKEKLVVDLDGGYGYGCGFIEESFGGMVRYGYSAKELLKNIEYISNDEPGLPDKIRNYIKEAGKAKRQIQKRKGWFK